MSGERVRCKHCGSWAYQTDWLPPRGLDPRLREFMCQLCKKSTYQIISEHLQDLTR